MGKYDDIIDLPHPVSKKHPPVSNHNRAGQFAPFAALTGYGGQIAETARLTDRRPELSEVMAASLNEAVALLCENIGDMPYTVVTYFQQDPRKEGGAVLTMEGNVRKVDTTLRVLTFAGGATLPMDDILEIAIQEDRD